MSYPQPCLPSPSVTNKGKHRGPMLATPPSSLFQGPRPKRATRAATDGGCTTLCRRRRPSVASSSMRIRVPISTPCTLGIEILSDFFLGGRGKKKDSSGFWGCGLYIYIYVAYVDRWSNWGWCWNVSSLYHVHVVVVVVVGGGGGGGAGAGLIYCKFVVRNNCCSVNLMSLDVVVEVVHRSLMVEGRGGEGEFFKELLEIWRRN